MDKLNCDRAIGPIIREIRIAKKMQQSDVIEFMQLHGVSTSKSSYSKLESGKQHIKISELVVLKKCFHITYEDFFKPFE